MGQDPKISTQILAQIQANQSFKPRVIKEKYDHSQQSRSIWKERASERERERERETWRLKSASHTYHRRVETPGARTHVFHTCSTIPPPSPPSVPTDKKREKRTTLLVHRVDSHGGRIAICNHTLRTMFCNCTFRNVRGGVGGFFVCRRTRFPQKRCSVWWKPFLFARARPQNHFLFLFGSKTRLSRGKEREREKRPP